MPERVTKEERIISMVIEKAREAKEILYQSMYDGNVSPMEDESEAVKVKRPKAENDKTKIKNNEGTHSGYGLAGEVTEFKKAVAILKQILESDYDDNPVLNRERADEAKKEMESALKELDMMRQDYEQGKLDEVKFIQGAQERLREATKNMQITEDAKNKPVPLLPKTQQYR